MYDSDNTPLEDAVKETPQPYATVYTDDDDGTDTEAHDLDSGTRIMIMIVEFGIAAPIPAAEQEGEGPKVAIPPTDASFELAVDALDRQIGYALFTDPRSIWGEHMRSLTTRVLSVSRKRGAGAEKGARFAARQIIYQLETIGDLAPGSALASDGAIALFLDAAEGSAERLDIAKAVQFLRSEIAISDDWSWRRVQGLLGLTRGEVDAIGMGPVKPSDAEAPDEETPALTDVKPDQTSTVVEPYPSEADKYGA
ncbi:hypothetical protein [Bradyrhizobium paxllaeri]|uniref:hypothetical protein n=1 Tax=Bradyrhizobium paxllaeri TaxID=190148 RepID=UPI001AED5E19|nr:hypothetical protein [Bradyrhizobium paxllaeri]